MTKLTLTDIPLTRGVQLPDSELHGRLLLRSATTTTIVLDIYTDTPGEPTAELCGKLMRVPGPGRGHIAADLKWQRVYGAEPIVLGESAYFYIFPGAGSPYTTTPLRQVQRITAGIWWAELG